MSTETKQQTRARMLEVAAELLAASPSGQISTREVCEVAGVKAPTLYHHFGDKDGLLQAVVTDGFERYLSHKRSLRTTGDPLTDFRRGWDMHVGFGLANPALYGVMYAGPGSPRTTPAARAAHADLVATMRELDDAGRLLLPVETAADVVDAAAVGTTLRLLRTHGTADAPMSAVVRDAVAAAVIGPARAPAARPVTPGLVEAAARLRAELPHGPVAGLRATETALLHEWLRDLTGAARPTADGTADG